MLYSIELILLHMCPAVLQQLYDFIARTKPWLHRRCCLIAAGELFTDTLHYIVTLTFDFVGHGSCL